MTENNNAVSESSDTTEEHVFLVGLQVRGNTRAEAEKTLMAHLPRPNGHPNPSPVECWWVAEDDRNDRSDNDSAVWVDTGAQQVAHDVLVAMGITGKYNKPAREGGQFTGGFEGPNHEVTRYEKTRAVHDLMATIGIGIGDLDLIDALDALVDQHSPHLDEDNVPAAFLALAGESQYEWHGMQEDLWDRLRDHTQDAVEEAGLLNTDEEDED